MKTDAQKERKEEIAKLQALLLGEYTDDPGLPKNPPSITCISDLGTETYLGHMEPKVKTEEENRPTN